MVERALMKIPEEKSQNVTRFVLVQVLAQVTAMLLALAGSSDSGRLGTAKGFVVDLCENLRVGSICSRFAREPSASASDALVFCSNACCSSSCLCSSALFKCSVRSICSRIASRSRLSCSSSCSLALVSASLRACSAASAASLAASFLSLLF